MTATYGDHSGHADRQAVQDVAKKIDEYQRLIAQAIATRIELSSQRVRRFSEGRIASEDANRIEEVLNQADKSTSEDASKAIATAEIDDAAEAQEGAQQTEQPEDADSTGSVPIDAQPSDPEAILLQQLVALDEKISQKESEIQSGIVDHELIVARWAVSESRGSTLSVPELFGAKTSSKTTQSGYMIVSGLQIRMLVLGPEFTLLPKLIDAGNMQFLKKMKIVSFAVQADEVAYTTGYDFEKAIAGFLELDPKKLASQGLDYLLDFDKIRLEGYLARAGALDNTGVIRNVDWRREASLLVKFLRPPSKLVQALEADWKRRCLATFGYDADEVSWYEVTASENLLPTFCPKESDPAHGDDSGHSIDRHITIYGCQIGSSRLVQYARYIDSPFSVFTGDDETDQALLDHVEGRVFVRLHKDDPRLVVLKEDYRSSYTATQKQAGTGDSDEPAAAPKPSVWSPEQRADFFRWYIEQQKSLEAAKANESLDEEQRARLTERNNELSDIEQAQALWADEAGLEAPIQGAQPESEENQTKRQSPRDLPFSTR
ncbi:MAG: hypothetical protein ACPGYV_03770 [Phycisphaeraceae bacterium]